MASASPPAPSERPGNHHQQTETEQLAPRTVSGKRPSAASLQREREYIDWLSTRAVPEGDAQHDDSWATFMAEREKARLQKVNERRRQQRHERGLQYRLHSDAEWLASRERERARLLKVTEARRAAREAAGLGGKRGRPIDPASRRQQKLAEQALHPAVRAERERERDAAVWAAELVRLTERMRAGREARCAEMLASLAEERRADAERLFCESVRSKDAATIAARRRDKLRHRKGGPPVQQQAAMARKAMRAADWALHAYLRGARPSSDWTTEGQCEGTTRLGKRCKVHKTSPYAIAGFLRRGERFCGHHHPSKYTGVRCTGMRKGDKGQCNVWSGSCYADAAPLRRGSPFCHHHRVRCTGVTLSGARCTVTSSSQHAHADPLRNGAKFCAHHLPEQPQPLQAPPSPPLAQPTPSQPIQLTPPQPPQPPQSSPPPQSVTLATSSDLETPSGPLPPSILILDKGGALDGYMDCLKQHFPRLAEVDLVVSESTKRVWVLPLETAEMGTLAQFLSDCGLRVEELHLDAESDEESDADSARCGIEDEELPPGVYRDEDGTVHDEDDGSYGAGSWVSPPPSPQRGRVIYDSD